MSDDDEIKPLNPDDLEEVTHEDDLDDLDDPLHLDGIKSKAKKAEDEDDSFDELAEIEDAPLVEDAFDDYDPV